MISITLYGHMYIQRENCIHAYTHACISTFEVSIFVHSDTGVRQTHGFLEARMSSHGHILKHMYVYIYIYYTIQYSYQICSYSQIFRQTHRNVHTSSRTNTQS